MHRVPTNVCGGLIIVPLMITAACSSNSHESPRDREPPVITASQSSALRDDDFIKYAIKPSLTDGAHRCDEHDPEAIGCDRSRLDAPNEKHVLYLNPNHRKTGRLLVYLAGQNDNPGWPDTPLGSPGSCTSETCELYRVAADQGYHVIALSYFSRKGEDPYQHVMVEGVGSQCRLLPKAEELPCYGKYMNEVLDGKPNCPRDICGSQMNISAHPQDSITHRLWHVLKWANFNHPNDGWDRYVNESVDGLGSLKWTEIAVAGFSLGSGYAALLGLNHPEVARVLLFSSPNDGRWNGNDWEVAPYLKDAGAAASKYFGLIDWKNHMSSADDENQFYKTYLAWKALGMEGVHSWDPEPGESEHFRPAQMLLSYDSETAYGEGHTSVVKDRYPVERCTPSAANHHCRIGFRPAWRYMLGSGLTPN